MKFPLGINNIEPETSLPEGALRRAENVDIHNDGSLRLRRGFTQIYSGTKVHSLFKRFFVEENTIRYLEENNTSTVIATTGTNNRTSYVEVNDTVFYTNGVSNGALFPDNSHVFGIRTPSAAPRLYAIPNGALTAGTYQVTVAYINQDTGEVSGAPTASLIEVQDGQAIQLEEIPQSNLDIDVIIFATRPGDSVFYEQKIVLKGTTDTIVREINTTQAYADSQNLESLPSGQLITYYKGSLYIAKDNVVWFSEPYRFGLCDRKENFYQFPSRVTVCLAVKDGIYIVADKTYFIRFNTHSEASITEVHTSTAVEGTGLLINGGDLNLETPEEVAYWFSSDGPMIGAANGELIPITEKTFAVDNFTDKVGTSVYSEYNGIKQVVSTMPSGGPASKMASTDGASLTIIRNGVVI